MKIKRFEEDFSVCKVKDITQINLNDPFWFLGKTDEELSLVCLTEKIPNNATHREDGWKAMRIEGELDFSLIGILSKISAILANKKIGIFVISTYNTDYILVKKEHYEASLIALTEAGYSII